MYLARIRLNRSRTALFWSSNPYRVHQRLMMAYEGDPRLLYRIEETPEDTQILAQSQTQPEWERAFANFPVLSTWPEHKPFDPKLVTGRRYRFRLLANPSVKKTVERDGKVKKTRLGLMKEEAQLAWLERKLESAGAALLGCLVISKGFQHSYKSPQQNEKSQTHLAAMFEGVLQAKEPERLRSTLEAGIGPAKGYGFGLLSLAPYG